MKTLFALFIFLISLQHLFGQAANLNIFAGLNVSTYIPGRASFEGGVTGTSTTPVAGFHAGALAMFSKGRFAIETGVVYESIGGDVGGVIDPEFGEPVSDHQFRVQYLQVPFNILYYVPAKSGKFFFGIGPYAAFGVSGTSAISFPNTNYSPETGRFIFDETDVHDYGVNFIAGIHVVGNFEFSVGYSMGLRSLGNPAGNPGNALDDYVFNFSIGHTIW